MTVRPPESPHQLSNWVLGGSASLPLSFGVGRGGGVFLRYGDAGMETRLRNEVFAARLNTSVSTCAQHSSNNVIIVNWVKLRVWAGVEKRERWV